MPRPALLFLSHFLPYPPDSGATIRTFNVLKQLRREFDVTVLMFWRRNHQPDVVSREVGRRALEELGLNAFEAVPIASEHSLARKAWDHLRSVVTRRAYSFYQYESPRFQQQLRQALARTEFRLVHVDSIDLHGRLGGLPSLPIVCTHHDIESHALRHRAAHATRAPLRRYIRFQARLVEETERALCPTFSANLVMSELDAERLLMVAPDAKVAVAPNGVDTAFFTPSTDGKKPSGRVIFVGHTYHPPNRDAVDFFLDAIWPRVRARCPAASFTMIGRGTAGTAADSGRLSSRAGVTAHGYVPDVRPHFANADCVVVPIRFGGGTRVKILDAWAMGRAVVSTSAGCEGLQARDGENILVRDTPEEFSEAVSEVLAHAELRRHLGDSGRRTVEELYSWDRLGSELRGLYRRLI